MIDLSKIFHIMAFNFSYEFWNPELIQFSLFTQNAKTSKMLNAYTLQSPCPESNILV